LFEVLSNLWHLGIRECDIFLSMETKWNNRNVLAWVFVSVPLQRRCLCPLFWAYNCVSSQHESPRTHQLCKKSDTALIANEFFLIELVFIDQLEVAFLCHYPNIINTLVTKKLIRLFRVKFIQFYRDYLVGVLISN